MKEARMKLNIPLFILVSFFLFILRIFFLYPLEIHGSLPDVLLIVLIYIALKASPKTVASCSFFLGILADIGGTGAFGFFSFCYIICGMTILKIKEAFATDLAWMPIALTFIFSLCLNFFYFSIVCFHLAQDSEMAIEFELLLPIFFGAFYTAVLSPFFLVFFDAISLLKNIEK
jgi:rod shape-determining protein MreD